MPTRSLKFSKRPRLRSLFRSQRMYELKADAEDLHYLDVVAGGAQVYTVRLLLDESETRGWRERGEAYLDQLAADVAREDGRFGERLERLRS